MLPLILTFEWLRSWAQDPSLKCLPFKNQSTLPLYVSQGWETSRHYLLVVMVRVCCWENVVPLIYHCNAKCPGKGESVSLRPSVSYLWKYIYVYLWDTSIRIWGVCVCVCVWVWICLRASLSSQNKKEKERRWTTQSISPPETVIKESVPEGRSLL